MKSGMKSSGPTNPGGDHAPQSSKHGRFRMSRYYGSLRDDNDKVAKMLEDESKKAIDRAIEIVWQPCRPVWRVGAVDSEVGRDPHQRGASGRQQGNPKCASCFKAPHFWSLSC